MKKKNLVATLAAIAISAIPLMAHDLAYTTPDEELLKEIKASARQEITAEQQQQNNADIAAKYERLTNDFNAFVDLMKDKSLANQKDEVVGQKIFMVIDDLAQSILAMPQPTRDVFTEHITSLSYRFAYQHNKKVTLKDLFNLATSLKTVVTFKDTPIVKLLATEISEDVIENWNANEYDMEFLNLVNTKHDELNYTIIDELNKATDKVLEVQNNASLKNRDEKYRAQVIWMAIDDFAQVVLELPEDEQESFMRGLLNANVIHLEELYNFCKDYVYYHNSAIEKIMTKYANNSNNNKTSSSTSEKRTSWWQGIIETFQHEK